MASNLQCECLIPVWIQSRTDGFCFLFTFILRIRDELQFNIRIWKSIRIHGNKVFCFSHCQYKTQLICIGLQITIKKAITCQTRVIETRWKINQMWNPLVRLGMEETTCCKVRLHLAIFIRTVQRNDRREEQFTNDMQLPGSSSPAAEWLNVQIHHYKFLSG